jgi:CRP-like cAMP-binding protein
MAMNISFSDVCRMTLFRGFDKDFIHLLDMFFIQNDYSPQTVIVRQGKLQTMFYLIVAGEVEVFHNVDGRDLRLDTLGGGDFCGEMNLFDPGIATASIRTLTPVQTLEISNDRFRSFIVQKPAVAADFTFQLAQTIVRRFRSSSEHFMHELTRPKAIFQAQQIEKGLPA